MGSAHMAADGGKSFRRWPRKLSRTVSMTGTRNGNRLVSGFEDSIRNSPFRTIHGFGVNNSNVDFIADPKLPVRPDHELIVLQAAHAKRHVVAGVHSGYVHRSA